MEVLGLPSFGKQEPALWLGWLKVSLSGVKLVSYGDKLMDLTLAVSEDSQTLLEPNLHDGRLLGIVLPSSGRAELTVATVAGKRYCIALDGVLRLHAGDFWEGNIIFDITVSRGEQVRLGDLTQLVFGETGEVQFDSYLKSIHDQVIRESLFVLQLSPSYGCCLTTVFKTIRIYSISAAGCEGVDTSDNG